MAGGDILPDLLLEPLVLNRELVHLLLEGSHVHKVVGRVDDAALPQHAGEVSDLGLHLLLGHLQLGVEAVAQLEHLGLGLGVAGLCKEESW